MSHKNLESITISIIFVIKAKKDVAQIFNNVLRRQIGVRHPTVEYINSKSTDILNVLVKG